MSASLQPPCLLLAESTWGGTLHAIRSLGRAGVPVLVAVAGEGAGIYGASRYCVAARDFDDESQDDLMVRLQEWADRILLQAPVVPVFPLSDRLVDLLHRSRHLFGPRYRLALPAAEVTETLLDKAAAFALADQCGLDVPAWAAVSTREEISATADLRLPVVVRPRRWSSCGRRYFKVQLHASRQDLREALEQLVADGAEVVVQERVPGPDCAVEWAVVYSSYLDGTVVSCTGRKRRQDAPEGGVMVWGETLPIPEVREVAQRFVEGAGFRGLGGIELKREGKRLRFIEFNPRLEAIHFLATRAGVDTVRMAYADLASERRLEHSSQRRAAGWLGNAWLQRLARTGDWRTAASDLAAFALARRKVFAIWSLTDPRPWWRLMVRLTARAAQRLRPNLRLVRRRS